MQAQATRCSAISACSSVKTISTDCWERTARASRHCFTSSADCCMRRKEYVRINSPFYPRFSREVLDSCLNDFELPTTLKLNSLSMGQKKKVFMSFALAAGTRLLLMDEPTNGLDIPSKAQFRRVVASHMTEDRMLIISTHQVHDVEQLLDHILILDNSRLLLDASVADLCEKYSFEYRQPGQPMDDVIYSEPSVQGNAVIAPRHANAPETQLNLELLFDAVATRAIHNS